MAHHRVSREGEHIGPRIYPAHCQLISFVAFQLGSSPLPSVRGRDGTVSPIYFNGLSVILKMTNPASI